MDDSSIVWRVRISYFASSFLVTYMLARWVCDFDKKMRKQKHNVCLHLDNFSGHYINYEPTNIPIVYFGANLTSWVQPLDAGIIRCFKAHYHWCFCKNALEHDELGEADIYNINLLQVLQMATVTNTNSYFKDNSSVSRHSWHKTQTTLNHAIR